MKFTPLRITLIYLSVALVWVATTDLILEGLVDDVSLLTTMQTAKGWFYVFTTGAGLYWLLMLFENQLKGDQRRIKRIEKSLTMALESANTAAWQYFVDSDSFITSSNHNHFFDYPESENITLNHVYERLHPEDLDEFKRRVNRTLQTGREFNIEYRIVDTNNNVNWLWTKGQVISGNAENKQVVGITSDINESKNLKKKLDLEQEKFEALFDQIPVLLTVYNPELEVVEVNQEFEEVLGWSSDDQNEKSLMELCYPDEEYRKEVISFMEKPGSGWKEINVTSKSGETRTQLWSNLKLSDSTVVGIGHDITKRKQLENENIKDKDILQSIFNKLPVFISIYDDNGSVVNLNDFAKKKLGYSKKDIVGGDILAKIVRKDEYEMARAHMIKADNSWINFDIYTSSGEVLKSTWTNIELSADLKIGVGLDITDIKELEEQLSLAVKGGGIGLWDFFPQTGKIKINDEWAEMLGYTKDELEPMNYEKWKDMTHPDDVDETERLLDLHFSGKVSSYDNEIRMRHKNGSWTWMLDRGEISERDSEGKPNRVAGTHVDITSSKIKEKELKESELLLRETQRVANMGTYTLDHSGEVKTSLILDQMFWLPEGKKLTRELWEEYLHPDYKYVAENYRKALLHGIPFEAEYKILNVENNRERWIYQKSDIKLDSDGKVSRIIGVMLDVTRTREQQQRIKRTLEQLRIAEQIAEIGYWEKNLQTEKLFWGDNKYVLFEADKTKGPLARNELFERIHPEDKKFTLAAFMNAEEKGDLDVSYRYKTRDGTYRTIREKAEIVIDSSSGEQILRGVSMDISSLREIEAQLEDERKRLRIITSLISDVVWSWDLENDRVEWSEGMETVFGYKRLSLPRGEKSWTECIHPEDKEEVLSSIWEVINGDAMYWNKEYRFIDSSDEVRYVLDQGYVYRDSEGKALQMVGALVDQSEEKKAEIVKNYQANLLSDISDAVIATDIQMKITSWNRAAEELYGWKEHEVLGESMEEVIKTEFEKISNDKTLEVFKSEGEWSGEVIQYDKHKEPIHILSSVRMLTDNEGEFSGAVAVNKDITALKQIQKRLAYEQSRFEYVTTVVSDAIWDANPAKNTLWWSEGLESHFKHKQPDPKLGYDIWKDNLHPDDREEVLNSRKEAEESGVEEWTKEYRFFRGDGSIAYVLERAFILRDHEGKTSRIIGALNDITIQKEAQKKLSRSEQQYRLLYKQSPLPMWIYDAQTYQFLSVNETAIETYGYSEEEFMEMTIFDLFLKEDQEKILKEAKINLLQQRSGFDVWAQKTKSGETILCELSGSNIYFKDKQHRLVVSIDITEQRKAEERAIKAVVEGEERERRRIANELHDGLGQYLSAANMHLGTIFSDSDMLKESDKKSFITGLQMLQHAISETRSISQNLLPKSIQDYGLKLAVESLINELKSSQEIKFHLFQKYDDDIVPDNIQINIYRIIQEAINNAIKHSGASYLNTQIVYSDGELICAIEDDGIGFDPKNIRNEGLGIQSMKTRVAAMSGILDIDSKINTGTLVTVIVPLNK